MTEGLNREVAVLNAALELPKAERSAYLDKACAGDVALRQRVEELLRAHGQAKDFLEGPAGLDFQRTVRMNIPLTEKPGDKIGRYKLLQQIGEGGCGVVYMAEQEEPVRRRVALKVIKLGMDTKSVIARFEAERQALALMDHPNIAKVLDAGATDTGRPYFVMELVRGIKITDFCDENKISMENRLKLFIQVCQAIQHAHQKGVIHRDIKPSNILVTVNDGAPVPKVIDFGIAKATQGRLTDKTLFTAFEQFIGTPAYMSPEQAEMTSLDIDTRSDIYSLGVLLYELLTGKTPFDPNELLQAGLDAMRRTIREIEPPKPSTRLSTMLDAERTLTASHRQTDPPRLIHLLRGDLDWIVMKSLEKDRARRYETANGFATDIQRHLNDEPVSACPPSGLYRLQKAVRRNKGSFAVGLVIAIVMLMGAIVSTSQAIRATRAEREQVRLREEAQKAEALAKADEQKAKTEAAKSKQVARFLEGALYGASPYSSLAPDRDRTGLREIVDRAAARVGQDLHDQPEVEAEMRQTLGVTYMGLDEWAKAEAMIREALRLRRLVFGETNKFVVNSLDKLSMVLCNGGKAAESEIIARQALAMNKELFGAESGEVAEAFDLLANSIARQAVRLTEAETLEREALALYRKLEGNENSEVAWTLRGLGAILTLEGKQMEAESAGREAMAMYEKLYGDENPVVFLAMNDLALALWREGKLADAESLYRKVLDLRKKILGYQHPHTSGTLHILGDLLADEGKLDEAESSFREALAIRRKVLGNENLDTAGSIHNLADVLRREGRLTEAETLYGEALAIRRKLLGSANSATTASLIALMGVLLREGKLSEAEKLYDDLLINAAGNNSETAKLLDSRGGLRARAGHWKEAIPDLAKAVELETNNSAYYVGLASLLGATGDLDEYRNLCQRYLAVSGKTRDPTTAYWTARLCVVVPCPGVDMPIVSRLADLALASEGANGHYLPSDQFLKAVVEYRLGHYASAADYAGKSAALKMDDSDDIYHMGDYAIVAMSDYQLKQLAEAQAALAKADELALTKVPRLEGGDLGSYWRVWVLAEGLHREAKALIEAKPSPASDKKHESH